MTTAEDLLRLCDRSTNVGDQRAAKPAANVENAVPFNAFVVVPVPCEGRVDAPLGKRPPNTGETTIGRNVGGVVMGDDLPRRVTRRCSCPQPFGLFEPGRFAVRLAVIVVEDKDVQVAYPDVVVTTISWGLKDVVPRSNSAAVSV